MAISHSWTNSRCGPCDTAILHIKEGLIEICSGGKGYHGDRSTSNDGKTGGKKLKLPGSGDTLHKIKAENTLHISLDG